MTNISPAGLEMLKLERNSMSIKNIPIVRSINVPNVTEPQFCGEKHLVNNRTSENFFKTSLEDLSGNIQASGERASPDDQNCNVLYTDSHSR